MKAETINRNRRVRSGMPGYLERARRTIEKTYRCSLAPVETAPSLGVAPCLMRMLEDAQVQRVRQAIEQAYGCAAAYVTTLPSAELFPDLEGHVDLFRLTDHPDATRCYVWPYHMALANVPGERITTILEGPSLARDFAVARPVTVES